MAAPLLFVHSPLVGPSTLRRLAEVANRAGHQVAVPDLTPAATGEPPRWRNYVDTAAASAIDLGANVAVVGHSGAGAYLPSIGAALGERLGSLVFVDAVVPPESGFHVTPDRMKELLDSRTVEGLLLPWLDWWEPEDTEALLPDAVDRDLLAADMPRLSRDLYDESVPVPDHWSESQCTYLKLSEAYEVEYATAAERAWPRTSINGSHLSTHTEPDRVLAQVTHLLALLQ